MLETVAARRNSDVVRISNPTAAAREANRRQPALVLWGAAMSDLAGAGAVEALRAVAPATPLVLLATSGRAPVPGAARWAERLLSVTEGDPMPLLEARLELAGERQSVPTVRELVTQLLGPDGSAGSVAHATVVVTELVANAILHVPGPCAAELTYRGGVLRVAVVDGGPGIPDLRSLDAQALGGRGMHIVSALASAWGVDPLESGHKAVWAELRMANDFAEL